jgi:hypothetical protein
MSLDTGPTPNPLPPDPAPECDRSIMDAIRDAQRDYARLLHLHSPSWSIDLTGAVRWTCSCSESTPRNTAAIDTHLLTEVRRARGPVRGPKK